MLRKIHIGGTIMIKNKIVPASTSKGSLRTIVALPIIGI
jgi:hypothetical protein